MGERCLEKLPQKTLVKGSVNPAEFSTSIIQAITVTIVGLKPFNKNPKF